MINRTALMGTVSFMFLAGACGCKGGSREPQPPADAVKFRLDVSADKKKPWTGLARVVAEKGFLPDGLEYQWDKQGDVGEVEQKDKENSFARYSLPPQGGSGRIIVTIKKPGDFRETLDEEVVWQGGSGDPPPPALPCPVVLVFDDRFAGLPKKQFGTFSHVKGSNVVGEEFRKHRDTGFLFLRYDFSNRSDEFGGWVLHLGDADWSRCQEGELILLCRVDPKTSFSVELKGPEIKSPDGTSGREERLTWRVSATDQQIEEQSERTYFETRVALRGINLQELQELTVVIHRDDVTQSPRYGEIGIRAVILTDKQGQGVEAILRGQTEK